MGDLKLIFLQTMLLACFANPGLARPEVDKGDLFFIAELAKTSNNQVVLTVGNENSILTHLPLLLTSAHLAEGGAFDQHLIVVTFNQKTWRLCIKLHKWCVLDKGSTGLHRIPSTNKDQSDWQQPFRSELFVKISWRRQELTKQLVEAGYEVLSTDMDVVYVQNPLQPSTLGLAPGLDLLVAKEHDDREGVINIGVYIMGPSAGSRAFMQEWVSTKYRKRWDQEVFQEMLDHNATATSWSVVPAAKGFSMCTLRPGYDLQGFKSQVEAFLADDRYGRNMVFFHCACWETLNGYSKAEAMMQFLTIVLQRWRGHFAIEGAVEPQSGLAGLGTDVYCWFAQC